jgi:hypothetical protein
LSFLLCIIADGGGARRIQLSLLPHKRAIWVPRLLYIFGLFPPTQSGLGLYLDISLICVPQCFSYSAREGLRRRSGGNVTAHLWWRWREADLHMHRYIHDAQPSMSRRDIMIQPDPYLIISTPTFLSFLSTHYYQNHQHLPRC